MCGRYAFALSNEEVYDGLENQLPRMFERGRPRWEREQDFRPGNYNVAPRQRMPIIHRDPEQQDRAMLHTAQWGLIPHWTKHPPTAPLNTINARSESLLDGTGGMWNALKGYKRCIIPAQGYYEWQKKTSSKVAHFTRLPSIKSAPATIPIMFFAGLYDTVKYSSPVESHFKPTDENDTREPYPTGNPLPLTSFTILTTTPPKDFTWLHDRMPCMLTEWEDVERWLDLGEVKGWEEGKGGTGELLRGRSGFDSYPVPPEVGKVGTNSPTFIQPVSERADGIRSFFQKQSPAKPKIKAEPIKAEAKPSLKSESKPEPVSVITGDDKEEGLGDDSNAPNPGEMVEEKPSTTSPQKDAKRKREDDKHDDMSKGGRSGTAKEKDSDARNEIPPDEDAESNGEKTNKTAKPQDNSDDSEKSKKLKGNKTRPGHQIEVVRKKDPDDGRKGQPAITNFFATPDKKSAQTKATSAPQPVKGTRTSSRQSRK